MCRVNQCCCGCTLKTGAIVCCVFTALAALSNIASGVYLLAVLDEAEKSFAWTVHDRDARESVITFLKVLIGVAFVNAALLIAAFICLLIGILTEKAGFIMVWLVIEMIQIVLSCIYAIICFFNTALIMYGISALAGNALAIYLWIVVFSYYHELREGGSRNRPVISPPNKGFV